MTVTVTVSLELKPDKAEIFWSELLPEMQAGTKAFQGALSVRALGKLDAPSEALLVGEWESAAAFETYFAWRNSTEIFQRLGTFLREPPTTGLWDVSRGDQWVLHRDRKGDQP